MAKRIKDITRQTTANELADDDYIPIDGATKRTRKMKAKELVAKPIVVEYGVTPFATLKAAYDNGQSVRLRGSFGITITLAPTYDDGGDADDVVMFGALVSNSVTGSDQYYILSVTKGEEGQADTWASHNSVIGTQDVKILSVDSSSWTGASTYTIRTKDAGMVVDFGTIPAEVTGLTIKIPSGVNSAYFKFTLPAGTAFANLSVTDASDNELNVINESKPSEFAAWGTIIARVMCGDVAYGVSKATQKPSYGEVTIGDKTYPTVTINGREWMAENLDYNIGHEGTPGLNPSLGFRWHDTATETMYPESYVEGLKFGKYYAPSVAFFWDIYRRGSAELRAGIPAMYRNFFDSIPEGWRLPTIEDFALLGFPYEEEEDADALNPSLCVDQSECKWGVNFKPTNSSGLSLVPSSYMHPSVIGSQNIHLVEDNAKKSTLEGVTDGYFETTLAGELKIDNIDNFNPSTVTGDYIVGYAYVDDGEEDVPFSRCACFDDCRSFDDGTHTFVKPVGEAFLEWLETADWNVIRLVRDAQ